MMKQRPVTCHTEGRRSRVREKSRQWNGMDYLEISVAKTDPSQKKPCLTLYFLNKLGPLAETIRKENVRIFGGTRIRDLVVEEVWPCINKDPERDDCLKVILNKFGDLSQYWVCLVQTDETGLPLADGRMDGRYQPLKGIDPVYSCLQFSFRVCCPDELDCKSRPVCPPPKRTGPEIHYLAKDYASFRQLILDRLALIMPEWKERHVPDVGIALVEILAYVGDYLSYFQDAVATEAYLETARQRISVKRHARLVDYTLHEGCNARAWIQVTVTGNLNTLSPSDFYFVTTLNGVPDDGTPLISSALPDDSSFYVFEPIVEHAKEPVRWREAHNRIRIYTWGKRECCLRKGATRITLIDALPENSGEEEGHENKPGEQEKSPRNERSGKKSSRDRILDIHQGDFLLFEEMIGPGTGNPADADPDHCHIVRVTSVKEFEDPLCDPPLPLLEVTWAEEDAIPFPLCLSTVIPSGGCRLVENITVVRGNVILADHGRLVNEDLGEVKAGEQEMPCMARGLPGETRTVALPFRPVLQGTPMTFSQPVPHGLPASVMLDQDPREALPWIQLFSLPGSAEEELLKTRHSLLSGPAEDGGPLPQESTWQVKRDLLGSEWHDYDFVLETDDDRQSHIRFGNGDLGKMPDAGTLFRAVYRTGSGRTGNVGAGAIAHLVMRNRVLDGVLLKPANPIPARGGTDPESIETAKLRIPYAFRRNLQRAIIADDYARLAERDFPKEVQRAACDLRWTGSWYEACVSIDQRHRTEADQDLIDEIRNQLGKYRRIGHDLTAGSAVTVPLDLTLKICVSPGHLASDIRAELLDRFSNRLLPDGCPGFFHPDNLTLGEDISLSRIVAEAGNVQGVENAMVVDFRRTFGTPGDAVETGILHLGKFEVARMDNDPSNREFGILTLDILGGR